MRGGATGDAGGCGGAGGVRPRSSISRARSRRARSTFTSAEAVRPPSAPAIGAATPGIACGKFSPSAAATVAATWLCVTGAVCVRSPSEGVSGPSTPIQMFSDSGIFSPWLFHPARPRPRPWSVVITNVVFPRYWSMRCISSQSWRVKRSKRWAE